jgi:hypothetical protein
MASSFSTDLKLELMVTGENAGTWGTKTNTNLDLLQQAIAGYQAVSIAGGAQTTALTMDNASLSNARNAVVKLTGTITGNQIVTIPSGIEKTYIVENGTSGAFTVEFKTVSGTGPTFSTTDKGIKIVYSDGTNVVDVNANLSGPTLASDLNVNGKSIISTSNGNIVLAPNGSGDVQLDADTVRIGDSNTDAVLTTNGTGDITISTNSGTNSGTVKIFDGANGNIEITPNGTGVVKLDGLSYPTADGTAGQFLKTNGAGVLSFASVAPYSIDFLVVAGGGGGGGRVGGGGGAGGFRTSTQTASVGTLITVTVGDGGAGGDGGATSGETGSVGSSSSISGTGLTTITSAGGGGGGGSRFTPGLVTRAATAGGSGGGGGSASGAGAAGNTPSTAPSQGNNGGAAGPGYDGGGGGGAGAVGGVGTGVGGSGGNGSSSSITGSPVTYAGGGGGCTPTPPNTNSPGGTGGGGTGSAASAPRGGSAGTVNTGGGGGGCRDQVGFAGGKGVVILSVPTVNYTANTTGSPTVTTSGANTIMQFNGSGSYTV